MSAAAVAVPRKGMHSAAFDFADDPGFPQWARKGGLPWLPTPEAFGVAIEKLTQVELRFWWWIARMSFGNRKAGRPEWIELQLSEMARTLKVHPNSASNAIKFMEEAGAIERRAKGGGKPGPGKRIEVRLLVDQLKGLRDVDRSEAEEDTANEAGTCEDATAETKAAESEPVISFGGKRVSLAAVKLCKACVGAVKSAFAPSAENKATSAERTTATSTTKRETPAPSDGENTAKESDANAPLVARLVSVVNREFGRKVGQPLDEGTAGAAIAILNQVGCPLDDLIQRLKARAGVYRSHGLLRNLATDSANAYVQAKRTDGSLSGAEKIRSVAAEFLRRFERLSAFDRETSGGLERKIEYFHTHAKQLADEPARAIVLAEEVSNCDKDAATIKARGAVTDFYSRIAAAVASPKERP